jgi:hypothetical protein
MYIIYFKPLIEFVPTIFVFSRDPPDFPRPGAFEADRIPSASPPARGGRRQEGRILPEKHTLGNQLTLIFSWS